MKRKTQEEYVNEVSIKNPNVEVIGIYKNTKTPIEHKCKIHGVIWKTTPSTILDGSGCKLCTSEKIRKARVDSQEVYEAKLKIKNPNVELVDTYIDGRTPTLHKCLIHNITFEVKPSNVLLGQGCSLCGQEQYRNKRMKTQDEYEVLVQEKNPNLEVVGIYNGIKNPIEHRCRIHNTVHMMVPDRVIYGTTSCPECQHQKRMEAQLLSHEEYCERLKIVNPTVIPLEEYKGNKISIKHKCLIHGIEWNTVPGSILNGCGCNECLTERISLSQRRTQEEYIRDLKKFTSDIICIDTYINNITAITHKCVKCGFEWDIMPVNLLKENGTRCPSCSCNSRGEEKVMKYLDNVNINYIYQKRFDDCKDKYPLPFDFYLPDLNKCIEYDGRQHFSPENTWGGEEQFKITVKHDQIKNEYCKKNNIPLLRIPYYADIETELENFLLAS